MGQFRQISTFVEVVARGSLSGAARAEGIAPAMIGRRLDALEARLGVKLLQRTTRKLVLTEFGASLLEHARRVVEETEAAGALAQHRQAGPSGLLRISMPAARETSIVTTMRPVNG